MERDMKKLVGILIALTIAPLLAAGPDITGKWTSWKQKDFPLVMQLESSGTTLIGTVRLGTGHPVDILDGKVEGDRVTFKAIVPNGDGEYPMMFSGRRSGRTIDFKCDVEVNVPGEKVEFGPACVARISVRRVAH
jgi:hypothetical protein